MAAAREELNQNKHTAKSDARRRAPIRLSGSHNQTQYVCLCTSPNNHNNNSNAQRPITYLTRSIMLAIFRSVRSYRVLVLELLWIYFMFKNLFLLPYLGG